MAVKHTLFRNLFIIALFALGLSCYGCWVLYEQNIKIKHQSAVAIPVAVQKIQKATQNYIRTVERNEKVYLKQQASEKQDSARFTEKSKPAIYSTTDSVAKYTAIITQIREENERFKRIDSIQKIQIIIAKSKTDSVIKGNQNLVFLLMDNEHRLSELDSINYARSANKIVAEQVKVRRSKFFFSRQDDFLKLKHAGSDTASINGKDYLFYPTENLYTNQLLFQFRGSYNWGTDKPTIGPGIELKFGGKGFNVAYLGDPRNFSNYFKKAALVFGLRLDILHTTFPNSFLRKNKDFKGY